MGQLQEQNLFTTSQVANILGVTRITVFRWIKEGSIKAKRIGRNYLIPQNELLKHTEILTEDKKLSIRRLISRAVSDYGETIRMLGRE